MKDRYIIYYKPLDQYVSCYGKRFMTSEFPEEYEVFESLDSTKSMVEQIASKFNLDEGEFEIEPL